MKDEEARISIYEHGFMYGLGLFETIRVYQGHPFLLYDHLDRLRSGLEMLQINWSFSNEDVMDMIHKLLEKNSLKDAYIRLNVSAGPGELGLTANPYYNPTTIMYIKPVPDMTTEKRGQFLQTVRNTPEGISRLKSHHFLNNILGKREIGNAVDTEGIFLTKEGYIAEGVVSNIFWLKNGVVYTPSVDTGILNGITRRLVIQLLQHQNIRFEEGYYKQKDVVESDEVFITNSIQEIVPLQQIHEYSFPGKEGKLFKMLLNKYHQVKSQLLSIKELREE